MPTKQLLQRLTESYIFIVLAALLIGIIFPAHAIKLAPYSTIFLGIIFFLSALKIDLKEVGKYLHATKMLVVVNLMMLIVLPIIVYYATLAVVPELAVAFLILTAMPCGMTAPLLSEICGGRQSLALVLTISTSLLAPFTVPFIFNLVAGASIDVSFLDMFLSLAKVIFIPFVLANIIKYFWQSKIKKTYSTFKPISIILLGLLITGIVAKQADTIVTNLQGQFLLYLVLLFVLFIVLHILGYLTVFWRDKKDRITTTVCLTYMNFTLAIYLVGEFFTEPNIVIPVVLSVLPWSLLIIPYKHIMLKVKIRPPAN